MCLEASVEMKLKVIIHEAEEDGYWAEVPAISAVQLKETRLRNC
jgi:hypothetical protein